MALISIYTYIYRRNVRCIEGDVLLVLNIKLLMNIFPVLNSFRGKNKNVEQKKNAGDSKLNIQFLYFICVQFLPKYV